MYIVHPAHSVLGRIRRDFRLRCFVLGGLSVRDSVFKVRVRIRSRVITCGKDRVRVRVRVRVEFTVRVRVRIMLTDTLSS